MGGDGREGGRAGIFVASKCSNTVEEQPYPPLLTVTEFSQPSPPTFAKKKGLVGHDSMQLGEGGLYGARQIQKVVL